MRWISLLREAGEGVKGFALRVGGKRKKLKEFGEFIVNQGCPGSPEGPAEIRYDTFVVQPTGSSLTCPSITGK